MLKYTWRKSIFELDCLLNHLIPISRISKQAGIIHEKYFSSSHVHLIVLSSFYPLVESF